MVGFEREPGESKEGSFAKEFGVKLVRGVTLDSQVTKTDADYYSVSINIDPIQYREDQSLLVSSRSKFLEDIYSHDF